MVPVDIVEVDHQLPVVIVDEIVDQDHDHLEIVVRIWQVIVHIVIVINNDLNVLLNVILDHVHEHVLHHQKHSEIKSSTNVMNQLNEFSIVRKLIFNLFILCDLF
jgi:hypothetical protein